MKCYRNLTVAPLAIAYTVNVNPTGKKRWVLQSHAIGPNACIHMNELGADQAGDIIEAIVQAAGLTEDVQTHTF